MDAMLLFKATLLMALTLLGARLLRAAPAGARHRFWTFAFAALLALPLLAWAMPALHVPVPAAWGVALAVKDTVPDPAPPADSAGDAVVPERVASFPIREQATAGERAASDPAKAPYALGQAVGFDPALAITATALLLAAWAIGSVAAAATLCLSLVRARRLAHVAEEVTDPAWGHTADALRVRLGLSRPVRVLTSPRIGTPMAGGVWRPVIFLPASARLWSAEQRDVVLAHEIAHLAGRDPLRHVMARLAVAVYWFHPLAWIAARQATVAREQACDEAVLALGTRPSAYARVLLELAESIQPVPALAALPMVERSLLETRLMAILNNDRRPTAGRRVVVPAIAGVLLTLSVAAAQPFVPETSTAVAHAPGQGATIPNAAAPATQTNPAAVTRPAMPGDAAVIAEPVRPESAAVEDLPPEQASIGREPRSAAAVFAGNLRIEQPDVDRDSACWWDGSSRAPFRGSMSMNESGGRTIIYEQVGTRGTDRVIQKSFGDLRLCMVAEGAGDRADTERPSQWLGRARRVVMETRRGPAVQRLEISGSGSAQRTSWRVGGAERPLDAAAERWRDRMLATLDGIWELSTLRGEVSSLRGEISSIRGQESSMRGEISSLRGEVSSMRGRISSIHGEESSLRGRISSIHGHVSSLRGAISSERGAISSLTAGRYRSDGSDRTRIAEHEAEIARLEREIRDYNAEAKVTAVEREIDALNADRKAAAIEAEIRTFDLAGKTAAIERRITALDVDGKVRAIERKIEALDAERRGRQLEERRDRALAELETAIAAIR